MAPCAPCRAAGVGPSLDPARGHLHHPVGVHHVGVERGGLVCRRRCRPGAVLNGVDAPRAAGRRAGLVPATRGRSGGALGAQARDQDVQVEGAEEAAEAGGAKLDYRLKRRKKGCTYYTMNVH